MKAFGCKETDGEFDKVLEYLRTVEGWKADPDQEAVLWILTVKTPTGDAEIKICSKPLIAVNDAWYATEKGVWIDSFQKFFT